MVANPGEYTEKVTSVYTCKPMGVILDNAEKAVRWTESCILQLFWHYPGLDPCAWHETLIMRHKLRHVISELNVC